MDDLNKRIGTRIKILREKANEYQKETAVAVLKLGENLTEGQLGTYENGTRKVPPNIVNALAKHFNTTTDFILCNVDKPEKDIFICPMQLDASLKDNVDLSEFSNRDKDIIKTLIEQMKKEKGG